MSGLPSDDLVEDYRVSLEDLTTNDRFQINNLTVIARENTEHAMAISRELENHIKKTPPQQKLPALYVVDSIVKNVGTPYTLFLGRNMYQTFMNAYTLVDGPTRRKLDEMLKTWKEPVPGSLDTRPVFPPEVTRNIESALIKARTAALERDRTVNRGRTGGTPTGWKNSPIPPQAMPHPPPQHPYGGRASNTSVCSARDPRLALHAPSVLSNREFMRQTPPQGNSPNMTLESLHRDLNALVEGARAAFARSPFDISCQQRLQALLDLQRILQQQQLPPDQLRIVQDQVSSLAATQPGPAPAPIAQNSVPSAPVATPPVPVSTPPTQPTPQSFQSLFNPGTLADLIKATANPQQPTPPPQIPNPLTQMPPMPPMPPASGTPQPAENPLIQALRMHGLLPSASAPPAMMSAGGTPRAGPLPFLMPGQPHSTPPAPTPQLASASTVPMNTASMKIPRIALVASLYEAKPNRCGTCGLRFLATAEGREKKARHLDWHFKTNQRMVDASKRAQNRSWYVDERDWIKSREAGDDTGPTDTQATIEGETGVPGDPAKQGPPKAWIRAPNDAKLRNTPCPICQEMFESTWSEDVQDWIWQDAIQVAARVYHASCYAEVTRDGPAPRSSTPQARTGTPDSVLGKRKAEGNDSPGNTTRVKMEPM
ncbi:mRNA cleavage factor complex component Pcf11 [Penicillium argentinense]|uniref:mRNA cleavage factor complex component Pcf11 n=1 Tax=Penicillium argentinense TaxID=1131581 RepID=A0A9W9K2I1_9EURO|nr:mRNA cleavage factor complex component Pcf11 [Penicillium argentinense]KAJ5090390.1 mRNA cleavage factor complex component Pcf11 [Penicillium argentinense]